MEATKKPKQPLYSVGTWDEELQAYTPQIGMTVPAFNITIGQLRQAVRDLRRLGYTAHRKRDPSAGDEALMYEDNDWAVLIERTDGKPEEKILRGWMRKQRD